jgi:hypothetical protein
MILRCCKGILIISMLSINAHICARKCAEKLLASPYFGKMTFFGKIKFWQNNALAK